MERVQVLLDLKVRYLLPWSFADVPWYRMSWLAHGASRYSRIPTLSIGKRLRPRFNADRRLAVVQVRHGILFLLKIAKYILCARSRYPCLSRLLWFDRAPS